MPEEVPKGPRFRLGKWCLVAALAGMLGVGEPAHSQVVLRVNEDVWFRFGALLQAWAEWQEEPTSGGYAQNLFLHRARLLVGGQVARDVTFFLATDSVNLGRTPRSVRSGVALVEAQAEWRLRDEFRLVAGLVFVPLCRNCQQTTANLLSLDYGTTTFLWTVPMQSPYGHDLGFMAKGYLAGQRLEYRIGAFQGAREAGSRNPFRSTGRIQYNLFDTETVVYYPGTYLGTKKILALGVGYDVQQDYHALAADVFFDYPLPKIGGVTAQADFIRYDGGSTFSALPPQNDWFTEAGLYVARWKLLPFIRFESQDYVKAADAALGQKRYQAGLTWFLRQFNFNIRGAWTRVTRRSGPAADQYTLQLQIFYF